jgi:hypothetical protein
MLVIKELKVAKEVFGQFFGPKRHKSVRLTQREAIPNNKHPHCQHNGRQFPSPPFAEASLRLARSHAEISCGACRHSLKLPPQRPLSSCTEVGIVPPQTLSGVLPLGRARLRMTGRRRPAMLRGPSWPLSGRFPAASARSHPKALPAADGGRGLPRSPSPRHPCRPRTAAQSEPPARTNPEQPPTPHLATIAWTPPQPGFT